VYPHSKLYQVGCLINRTLILTIEIANPGYNCDGTLSCNIGEYSHRGILFWKHPSNTWGLVIDHDNQWNNTNASWSDTPNPETMCNQHSKYWGGEAYNDWRLPT